MKRGIKRPMEKIDEELSEEEVRVPQAKRPKVVDE